MEGAKLVTIFVFILNCIITVNAASIGHALDQASGDVTANKTSLWDTLPDFLKEIHTPNQRMFDPSSFVKTMPAMRRIEEENRVLRKLDADELFLQGDIYLGPKVQRNAILADYDLWPYGVVPYEIDSAFDSDSVARIEEGMNQFHIHTCIRFTPRSQENDYLYIYPGNGCWSYVGKSYGGGRQPLSLGNGCTYGRTTPMHEFMHAVGFYHEQGRTDRDGYVEIYWQNIITDNESNFEKHTADYVQDLGTSYDYYSIMHYHSTAFTINGSPTILPKQSGISPDDLGSSIDFTTTDAYKLNALYKCDDGGIGGNECSHTHELTSGNHVRITSTNYPQHYDDIEDCTWIITNTDGGNVELSFTNFDTEAGYDYVQFGSGSTVDSNAEKHSGTTAPTDFTSAGDTAWVSFLSDGSQTRPGFQLVATAVQSGGGGGDNGQECGRTHELTSGNHVRITSTNYPEHYNDNEDCTWVITNSDGGNVELSFTNFDTEGTYDYVQFGSGSTVDSNAEKHSGNTAPSDFTSSGETAWISFHSDGSQTRPGFQLVATALQSDGGGGQECSHSYELTSGNHVRITSTNYPQHYNDNEDCTWVITNSDGGNVELSFTNFDTESGYDYVQFGSGSTVDSNAVKHSGDTAPSDFTSSGDKVWISFHSDGSQTRTGFQLVATAVRVGGDCRADHTLTAGQSMDISSPNYPSNYDDNTACTWIITNSDGGNIILHFEHMDTEVGYDYVQFGSGGEVDFGAEKHDGENIPSDFTSTGSTLWILFHSDSSATKTGFKATVTAGNDDDDGEVVGCNDEYDLRNDEELVVTSPNHPGNYDDNKHCTWIIKNTEGGILTLDFVAMDTEAAYDYVQFGSGLVSNPNAAKHDGTNLPANYNTDGAALWIVFHSDGSVSKTGFKANVRASTGDTGGGGGNDVCGGGPFNIGDGEVWNIQTPNYPSNYGDNMACTWIFTTSGTRIQYEFDEMDTETGYDYLQFGSGSSPDANVEKHWGSSIPDDFVSSGSDAWLTFHSDGSVNAKGFSISVSQAKL